ncbi:GIY-YIG nuclease family protein [Ferrimonas marina]|uniref:Putative endonuclease n=1 Tax=Ferrimonas marina TaxID=299255 RepID=A0A1M5QYP8_9GAMM|nr:GIY-YIG nuclease family protein [Ferrimonas marina]SHH18900.1 putative endonuclease [Ferrimonas marina]
MSKPWWIYLIRTRHNLLYTGITTDVERRFKEHSEGKRGARALKGKGPLTLEFQAELASRSEALRLEYQVKQWPKSRKERLIQGKESLPGLD